MGGAAGVYLRLLVVQSADLLGGTVVEVAPSCVLYLGSAHNYDAHIVLPSADAYHAVVYGSAESDRLAYFLLDCSESGTRVNAKRLASALPLMLAHGDRVEIGGTVLQVHFFDSSRAVSSLCNAGGACAGEAGGAGFAKVEICNYTCRCTQTAPSKPAESAAEGVAPAAAGCVREPRRRARKGKGAVARRPGRPVGASYAMGVSILAAAAQQPAAARVPPAEHLTAANKGYQIMQRLGWRAGTGLGRHQQGATEPVEVALKKDKRGLG